MSNVLTGETFPGARRWELPDFGPGPGVTPPTVAHLDELESAAYEEGFARGHAEGWAAGAEEARSDARRLKALLQHLTKPLQTLDAEVESALVALTIEIARRLVQQELALDPARVAATVEEAVAALAQAPRDLRVHVHPDDVSLVKDKFEVSPQGSAWQVVADASLMRGDCRIASDSGQIDATLDTRQSSIAHALLREGPGAS